MSRGFSLQLNDFVKMSEVSKDFVKSLAQVLSITEEKILKKAAELVTLLNSKPNLGCSGTCKGIICLDIASSLYSSFLDREEAVKYSGCKKKYYINMFNNISKLLNLDKVYSIREICLIAGVCDISEAATKLFEKFKVNCDKIHYDFEHPMYSCAAVLAVCKSKKIKVNQTKIVEISRVKKKELEELMQSFSKIIDVKIDSKNSENVIAPLISLHNEKVVTTPKRKATSKIMTDEEYENWKRKMLE